MQLPAQATLEHAAALAAGLPAALAEAGDALHIDASPLRDFDSSTVALLLQAHRLAQAAGRGFEVTGAPPQLVQLAQLYGVDGLLWPAGVPAGSPAPASDAPARPVSA